MFKFRELNKTTYEMLINGELWCATPKSLNDPFDAQFDYEAFGQRASFPTENDDYAKYLARTAHDLFENMGICSFSKDSSNQVMWSHYVDEHRGLCIEFDISQVLELNSELSLAPVTYQSELPESQLVKTYEPTNEALYVSSVVDKSVFLKILATKDLTWSYEQEVRIIKPEYGVIKFTPECIVSISFGLRASHRDINSVRRLLSNNVYSHIKWRKARKSKVTYSLEFEAIEI
ncbi:hypothetical protein DC58_09070 [Vibrio navarrensis]|uniref:DUF2971 domain-containing protein n=1 Tax=Vibrio navarrensis TaxID=29495 RepID=UPI00052E1589|nr:hypothetical protein DC58_09070 [Vibrio navarrensis]